MTHRVLIAGSGIAAVEAVLALRSLAGRGFDIELLAPKHALVNRPASVAAPFGFDAPPPLALHDLARRFGVGLVEGELTRVDVERRIARVDGVEDRPYDHLLVAVGARREPAVPGALTFRGERDVPSVRAALDEVARRNHGRVVVVVPAGIAWPLPAYELAILTRSELDMRGAEDASVTLVTPEQEPLWIFGEAAGDAIRELLDARGIALRTRARPARAGDGVLWLESGDALAGDTVLSLPRLSGRRVGGLPADTHGFLPTDAYGRVVGAAGVLAAGDVTTFPVKQGGLATQQADAAAATIAHELGAAVAPQPFAPVLRGLLLTGGAPLYLRAELDPSGERRGTRSRRLRGRRRRARCGGRPARSQAATSRRTCRRRARSRSSPIRSRIAWRDPGVRTQPSSTRRSTWC